MRRIRALAGKLAQDNFKEIQACQNNPTPNCINKIKAEYKDVNFAGLQDAYREYQGTHTILNGYAYRNNSVVSCADSGFADCIVRKDGERVMQEGAYAAIGGVRAGRNQVTAPTQINLQLILVIRLLRVQKISIKLVRLPSQQPRKTKRHAQVATCVSPQAH